jgi:hypothetical protein
MAMEYLHQSTYGHAGGFHTAKPVMAMDRAKGHIYDIKNGVVDTSRPIFAIKGGKAFATEHHENGASPHAMFNVHETHLETTINHPNHSHILQLKKQLG